MSTRTEATIEDLYAVSEDGKAELVNGEVVKMPPTGGVSGRAGGKIEKPCTLRAQRLSSRISV